MHRILGELREQAPSHFVEILRYFLLDALDRNWKEHLNNMDHLRDGIGLRGYGQKDPKQEYKREGFELFQEMLYRIKEKHPLCPVPPAYQVRSPGRGIQTRGKPGPQIRRRRYRTRQARHRETRPAQSGP